MSLATKETHAAKVARLNLEHRQRIEKLKREGVATVSQIEETYKHYCDEWDLQREHQREEQQIRRQNDDARDLAYVRGSWTHRRHLGLPITLGEARKHLADIVETDAIFAEEPRVVRLRRWLSDVATANGIDVREDALPQLRNGSAIRSAKRVIVSKVQSLQTAAVAGHELGHVLGDVDPDAPKKPGEFGLGTICVSDELNAWRWVLQNFPIWEMSMHGRMSECLASYRPHASADEAQEIDFLCSSLQFLKVKNRLVMGPTMESTQ